MRGIVGTGIYQKPDRKYWYLSLLGTPDELKIIEADLKDKGDIHVILGIKIHRLRGGGIEQRLYATTVDPAIAAFMKLSYYTG